MPLVLGSLIALTFASAAWAGSLERPGDHRYPAFAASRYPDTIDTRGPYRVTLRQLAGSTVSGGHAVYSVTRRDGTSVSERTAPLECLDTREWLAEIPGQPRGSKITYHFRLFAHRGERWRHPARASTGYQFHVVSLQLVSVTAPTRAASGVDGARVSLLVRADSAPTGEMVARLAAASTGRVREQRLPLSQADRGGRGNSGSYLLTALLPHLDVGQVLDFYLRLRAADGSELHVPEGAPAVVYSVKRSIRRVLHLPAGDGVVLGVSAAGRRRWVGVKGGGAVAWDGEEGRSRRWSARDGLPSGVVRFVLPDPASGRVFLGTDRGVAAIEPGETTLVALTRAHPYLSTGEESFLPSFPQRAGPAALSTTDGTLLFQAQDETSSPEGTLPRALLFEFRHGRLNEWKPAHPDVAMVGLSTALFDDVDGCWLLGGFVDRGDLRPAAWRRCGESLTLIFLGDSTGGLPARRIVALGRDPSTGDPVVALETSASARQQSEYGVYRLQDGTDRLSPLAPELAALGVEVTSVVTDWRRGRILIGTIGKGLLEARPGLVRRLHGRDARLSIITTLALAEASDTVLIGTSRGAFELSDQDSRILPIGSSDEPLVPTDALPTDAHPPTGRVLLVSPSSGLVHLGRSQGDTWQPLAMLSPGRELPHGSLGEAQYTSDGGLAAILHSQGLLTISGEQVAVLGAGHGLRSPHLLRLLARPSGDIWVAHTPTPFGRAPGAALQTVRGNRVVLTRYIPDRLVATISRWVEVPERGSVFAATQAGVIEFAEDGTPARRSVHAASSIARSPETGTIGVVGATVERWVAGRFRPVLFRLDHPRWPSGRFHVGPPIDLAIDGADTWYVLFPGGVLALLGPGGEFIGLLDPEDGIPATARRLLVPAGTRDVLVGSLGEGLVVVRP